MALPLIRQARKVEVADGAGNIRGFTLSSAPFEHHLVSTTRLHDSASKRVLRDAPIGTQVALDARYGSFTLHNNTARPAVFLTEGIGITPARSIVLPADRDKTAHKIFVFDANKRPEQAAYLDDLAAVAESNENITFVPTMDHMAPSERSWSGETGVIDQPTLSTYIDDLTAPIYYRCGPPGMVTAMRTLLNGAGVDDDDIRTEEFTGY